MVSDACTDVVDVGLKSMCHVSRVEVDGKMKA